AARPAGGLRAGGARVREADADERDGVPAQGADVRALLADRRSRPDAARAASTLFRRDRLAPPPALRERDPAPRPARDIVRAARPRTRVPGRHGAPAGASRGSARRRRDRVLL